MGIRGIWLVESHREAFDCSQGSWTPADTFTVPGTDCLIQLNELWTELDALGQSGL